MIKSKKFNGELTVELVLFKAKTKTFSHHPAINQVKFMFGNTLFTMKEFETPEKAKEWYNLIIESFGRKT